MSYAAKTVFAFGCYILALGASLVLFPNPVLGLLRMPPTTEVWIRVAGLVLLNLGANDLVASRSELRPYMTWSVPLRALVIVFFGTFVLVGLARPGLWLLGILDLAGALWTWSALRRESLGQWSAPGGARMSYPAKTVFVFGCLTVALAAGFVLIPNRVLGLLLLPPTMEVWIRVAGVPMLVLGASALIAGRSELRPYITWSVPLRASGFLVLGAFVLAGLTQPGLWILGVINLAGALWTWSALRSGSQRPAAHAA